MYMFISDNVDMCLVCMVCCNVLCSCKNSNPTKRFNCDEAGQATTTASHGDRTRIISIYRTET